MAGIGWHRTGYNEGFEGKEEKPPVHSSCRASYRAGYLAGCLDRALKNDGKEIVGYKPQ